MMRARRAAADLTRPAIWLLFGWALLAPLTIPIPGPGGVRISISDLLGLATLALVAATLVQRPRGAIIVAPVLLFIGWALVCTIYNLTAYPNPIEALFRVARAAFIASPLLLAALFSQALGAKRRARLIDAWLFASLAGMLIGVVAHYAGFSVAPAQTYDYGRGLVPRATGLMGDAGAFGHLAASAAAVAIALLLVQRRPSFLRLTLCFAIIAALPMFFYASLARAPLVDLIAVLLAVILLAAFGVYDRARVFTRLGVSFALFAGALGFLASAYPVEWRTAVARLDLDSFIAYADDPAQLIERMGSGRSDVWKESLALAERHVTFGLGYKGLTSQANLPGDNLFITTFADLGLLGVLILGSGLIALSLAMLWVSLTHGRGDPGAAMLAPVWLGQLVHTLFVDITTFYSSFPLILMLVGLALFSRGFASTQRAPARWRHRPGSARHARAIHHPVPHRG